jgi:hypothetical protein
MRLKRLFETREVVFEINSNKDIQNKNGGNIKILYRVQETLDFTGINFLQDK